MSPHDPRAELLANVLLVAMLIAMYLWGSQAAHHLPAGWR